MVIGDLDRPIATSGDEANKAGEAGRFRLERRLWGLIGPVDRLRKGTKTSSIDLAPKNSDCVFSCRVQEGGFKLQRIE